MALIEKTGNPYAVLEGQDFTDQGDTKDLSTDLALVVGCATKAEDWRSSKQWALLWRDADLLFQAPRPMSVFENTYVLEPNVQRFTVAKVCNSVVPQLYKGLFFEDPPMVLRPRPGVSQETTEAKTAIFSYLLEACQFKRDVKWGLEQMCLLGTGIWKWGIQRIEKQETQRVAKSTQMDDGVGNQIKIYSDDSPDIKRKSVFVNKPFFEYRPINNVLIDPSLKVGDIREAGYVEDICFMTFYDIKNLKDGSLDEEGKQTEGWTWGEYASDAKLKELWEPPVEAMETPDGVTRTDTQGQTTGVVHHGEEDTFVNSADPLAKKVEVIEYWDCKRKIIVLNRRRVIFSGTNPFKKIPFLSSNWWNRPKAFYGMGIGLTVGQNQRVDQGVINSVLKLLSFGVNPIYTRTRDSNAPTQMIRTGIGKILTVDGKANEAFHLLDTPKVPAEVWAALQNSESNTESTTGADQALVQGSSAGPRNGMGRSATGANALASASATRLDGPLDNFIDQVFLPFLYILDELVYEYMSDKEIEKILGEEMGEEYLKSLDLDDYHKAFGKIEFEVLAGASLAAKRTMAQSMTLITNFMMNPAFNEFLADTGKYIDYDVVFDMWLMASEWKDRQDIIKKLTPEMQQQRMAKMQAQQQASMQTQSTLQSQKSDDKKDLENVRSQHRLENDLVRYAVEKSAQSEVAEGVPGGSGFGDIEGM